MAVRYEYVYTVHGAWRFPIDMLRYDRATPFSEGDSSAISMSLDRMVAPSKRGSTTVKLIGARPPTIGRWNSFGYMVLDVDKQKVA